MENLAVLTNLKKLYLDDNPINQIGKLKSLSKLKRLNINNDDIDDISELKNFKSLQWVRYRNKDIIDMTKLNDLISEPNKEVKFADKSLEMAIREKIEKPIGAIKKSELQRISQLNLWDKNITNLSGIENLIDLRVLNLGKNNITDLNPLKNT